jgi:hypothetical protein
MVPTFSFRSWLPQDSFFAILWTNGIQASSNGSLIIRRIQETVSPSSQYSTSMASRYSCPAFSTIAGNSTISSRQGCLRVISRVIVDKILSDTKLALNNTNLGGVLYFFPLRVAGARVTSKEEAEGIVTMLKEISKRSFVVAEAFVLDLKALWIQKGL